jgi:hypothetical protein
MKKPCAYSSKMQCAFIGWRVIADGELALDLPAGNYCDMTGAIEIALHVMPIVFRIVVFVDGAPDIQYCAPDGKWVCLEYRKSSTV